LHNPCSVIEGCQKSFNLSDVIITGPFLCQQVIWPPVKEGAQSFYSTVKKIEFSPDHYRELFILYQEAKAGKRVSILRSCSVSVLYCKSVSVSCHEKWRNLVLTVKTAVLLGKRMYHPSLKTYASLAFTNNVKSLY